MATLAWIQNTEFSTWTRESSWALFAFLIIHTISMGFLVGTAIAINLRILGFASQVPLINIARLFPVMIYSIVVAICSGILLVIAYPAKALTNPIFYLKLSLITIAMLLTFHVAKPRFMDSQFSLNTQPRRWRGFAIVCLLLWATALTAGKFLAYTNKVLLLY